VTKNTIIGISRYTLSNKYETFCCSDAIRGFKKCNEGVKTIPTPKVTDITIAIGTNITSPILSAVKVGHIKACKLAFEKTYHNENNVAVTTNQSNNILLKKQLAIDFNCLPGSNNTAVNKLKKALGTMMDCNINNTHSTTVVAYNPLFGKKYQQVTAEPTAKTDKNCVAT